MSIEITYSLVCDGDLCHKPFGEAEGALNWLTRHDFEDLRARAYALGWARFRIEVGCELGDYCPKCTAELKPGIPRRAGKRAQ
jgi:hypothetical protein